MTPARPRSPWASRPCRCCSGRASRSARPRRRARRGPRAAPARHQLRGPADRGLPPRDAGGRRRCSRWARSTATRRPASRSSSTCATPRRSPPGSTCGSCRRSTPTATCTASGRTCAASTSTATSRRTGRSSTAGRCRATAPGTNRWASPSPRAFADFVTSVRPQLTIMYHGADHVVSAATAIVASPAAVLAYADVSGYPLGSIPCSPACTGTATQFTNADRVAVHGVHGRAVDQGGGRDDARRRQRPRRCVLGGRRQGVTADQRSTSRAPTTAPATTRATHDPGEARPVACSSSPQR